jgi:F420H(2)-dependent quinone reductase
MAMFASKAGAPTNPDWHHNVLAHPYVIAELGIERRRSRGRVAVGAEREQLMARTGANTFPRTVEKR